MVQRDWHGDTRSGRDEEALDSGNSPPAAARFRSPSAGFEAAFDRKRDPIARPRGRLHSAARWPADSGVSGSRYRLGFHQRGGDRRIGHGDPRRLSAHRRPAHRGRAAGPERSRTAVGRPPGNSWRGHHRERARADRRIRRRRFRQRRNHRAQNRRHPHLEHLGRRAGGYHFRNRRPGFEIHLDRTRRGGGFRHERGLRGGHGFVPGRAGRETGRQYQGRVRQAGAQFRQPHSPGRTLHGLHGTRRHGLAAQGRNRAQPGGRTVVFDRAQLSEPRGSRTQNREGDLFPGRNGVQRRSHRGLRQRAR